MATKNTDKNYYTEILECSVELNAYERIKVKDISNAKKLDEIVTDDIPCIIQVSYFAVLHIHNEKGKDKDYTNYILVDNAGNKYVTGSPSFWESFCDIYAELKSEGITEFSIEVFKRDSKNYAGKKFISCALA